MTSVTARASQVSRPMGDRSGLPAVPLGRRLVQIGLVTAADVERALEEQRMTGRRLGEILVAQHALFEDDLSRTLADLNGLAYRDLELEPPDPDVSSFVPEAFCRRRVVLPVELDGGSLLVAISDPLDLQTFDDLRTLTDLPLIPVMATPSGLREAIEVVYAGRLLDAGDQAESPGSRDLPRSAEDDLRDPAVVGRNDRPVVEFVNQMLRRAVSDGASDIHLEPTTGSLRIRFRVDGVLRDAMDAPASFERAVINRIKVMSDMDISDHRRPQDGRMSRRIEDSAIDVRAATIPTINGEVVVLRLLIRDTSLLQIDRLGFGAGPLDAFKAALRRPWGMILVTGPTGSGKSTTLYAGLNELNSPSRNTVTIEDPIEYRIAGIKQTQLDPGVGYTFASGLRAVVRADPDVILVGEIRDLETAKLASEAALTGHLVLSTLHANDAASSTTRLHDLGLPPYLVTSTLGCVVAQRLIRRLCSRCKSVEAASPEELHELVALGVVPPTTTEVSLPRANGCERCAMTGYHGRIAVQEVMVMDEALHKLVLERAPAESITAAAVDAGMQTLKMDAYTKVQSNQTTVDELLRVAF